MRSHLPLFMLLAEHPAPLGDGVSVALTHRWHTRPGAAERASGTKT
jgi:hypothetical protein